MKEECLIRVDIIVALLEVAHSQVCWGIWTTGHAYFTSKFLEVIITSASFFVGLESHPSRSLVDLLLRCDHAIVLLLHVVWVVLTLSRLYWLFGSLGLLEIVSHLAALTDLKGLFLVNLLLCTLDRSRVLVTMTRLIFTVFIRRCFNIFEVNQVSTVEPLLGIVSLLIISIFPTILLTLQAPWNTETTSLIRICLAWG